MEQHFKNDAERTAAWKLVICFLAAISFIGCINQSSSKKQEKKHVHVGHDQGKRLGYADSVNAGLIAVDTMKGSTPRVAMATIGNTHVHISYYAPGVQGRIIWGGLVPYNAVWVTGAHSATNINISRPIVVGKKKIDAGTYAIFTIPGKKEWIFILNKNYQQHLTDNYAEQEDVLRVTTIPMMHAMTQRLTYQVVKQTDKSGSIDILWEKIKLTIPFETIQ